MTEGYAFVFARCLGLMVRAPGFSHASVPPVVRAALAFVLAAALGPVAATAGEPVVQSFVIGLLGEFAVGFAIGFAASLLFEGASAGGRMLDDYVGIQVSNPIATAGAGQAFQQLWGLGFVASFFVLDGYQPVLVALSKSFGAVPPGRLLEAASVGAYIRAVPGALFTAAVLVAGPALTLGFVANVALGAISRVIPRFTSFSLTFPVVFTAILLASLVTIPYALTFAAKPFAFMGARP